MVRDTAAPPNVNLAFGRLVSVLLTVGSLLMALYLKSVIDATVHFVTLVAFVGIPMWVAIVWTRANRWGAWASLLLSGGLWWWLGVHHGVKDGNELLYPMLVGFAAMLVVSAVTKPESAERLQRFYALLHTPVGDEAQMERANLKLTLD